MNNKPAKYDKWIVCLYTYTKAHAHKLVFLINSTIATQFNNRGECSVNAFLKARADFKTCQLILILPLLC